MYLQTISQQKLLPKMVNSKEHIKQAWIPSDLVHMIICTLSTAAMVPFTTLWHGWSPVHPLHPSPLGCAPFTSLYSVQRSRSRVLLSSELAVALRERTGGGWPWEEIALFSFYLLLSYGGHLSASPVQLLWQPSFTVMGWICS